MSAFSKALVDPDRLLVVIPALNESKGIRRVVAQVRAQVSGDILVVDDGSTDDTAGEARQGGAIVAVHAVNLGYGAALQTGYRYALRHGYGAVLQLDADGQHDPASIPALLEALSRADVVVGSRFLSRDSYRPPFARRIGMWMFARVASVLCGQRVTDPTSGFQAVSRAALSFFAHERYPVDYPDADVLAMVAQSGLRLAEVPVRMLAAEDGKSMHAGLLRPIYYVFRMTLALALVPLPEPQPMTQTQRIFALVASLGTLLFILELVRRRKLREEYSWLWILTSCLMILLVIFDGTLLWFSKLIGAVLTTTTLFLFALLFLLLISVHFSTVISRLTQQVRRLTQELAILSAERDAARVAQEQRGAVHEP